MDFTGGVAEKLVLAKVGVSDTHSQIELFNKVKEALENHALINCNIEVTMIDSFYLNFNVGAVTFTSFLTYEGRPKSLHNCMVFLGTVITGKKSNIILINLVRFVPLCAVTHNMHM